MCIERILDRFYNLENFYHKCTSQKKLTTNKLGFDNNINSQKRKEKKLKIKNEIYINKRVENG